MKDIIEKIQALPETSGIYLAGWKHTSKGITPEAEPTDLTTDDLKSLASAYADAVSRAEKAEKAIEQIRHHASTHNLRTGDGCTCDMCEIFEIVEALQEDQE